MIHLVKSSDRRGRKRGRGKREKRGEWRETGKMPALEMGGGGMEGDDQGHWWQEMRIGEGGCTFND